MNVTFLQLRYVVLHVGSAGADVGFDRHVPGEVHGNLGRKTQFCILYRPQSTDKYPQFTSALLSLMNTSMVQLQLVPFMETKDELHLHATRLVVSWST